MKFSIKRTLTSKFLQFTTLSLNNIINTNIFDFYLLYFLIPSKISIFNKF